MCKSVRFFAGVWKKYLLKGETEPENGPDCPCKDTLPESAKKGDYSLFSDRDTGSPDRQHWVSDSSTVIMGRDSCGIYAIDLNLQDRIMLDQEELPCQVCFILQDKMLQKTLTESRRSKFDTLND